MSSNSLADPAAGRSFQQALLTLFTPAFLFGVVLSAALIFSGGYYLKQSYQDELTETASVTTKGVSSLLTERFQNYRTVLKSIANHNREHIFGLAAGNGSPDDLHQISADLFSLFADAKAFAIIDAEGREVVSSRGYRLGPLREAQMQRVMSEKSGQENVELHQAYGDYHFDVIARVERGDEMAALFASFSLRPLHRLLTKFATAELKLTVVSANEPKQIILSSTNFLGEKPEYSNISPDELRDALASEGVKETNWTLLALPANQLFSKYARKIDWMSWLLFVVVLGALLLSQYYLKRANLARFQAEKKASYSALFNAGPTVLLEKNLREGMSIEYVSPNVRQLLGFTPEELVNEHSFYDLVHEDDLGQYKRAVHYALQNQIPSFEIEYRLIGADWRYLWVYSLVHLNPKSGKVQCYITSMNEQKMAEQQAISLIENAPDAMFVTDVQGRVLNMNKMAEKLFGYTKQALAERPIKELVPCYEGVMAHLIESGGSAHQECLGRTWLGDEVPLAVSLNSMQSSEGEVIVSVVRDISVQKEAEEKMRLAKEQAESLAEDRRRFTAMISHEIRTPMNGVLGMADLLAATSLDSDQQTYVEAIRESGSSLISILNDVLDFSKLEEGLLQLNQAPFSLQEVVDRSIQLLVPQAKLGQVSIQQAYGHDCPVEVIGDGLRLRQILLNLIGNAVKFSPNGQVYIGVEPAESGASPDRGGEFIDLQFTIQDNGIGIDRAHQQELFTPFKQVDSSLSRHHGGTGLGLAITKQLVELMNGEIQVTSEPGQGSTFIVTLPFKRTQKDALIDSKPLQTVIENAEQDSEQSAAITGSGKVLLVEDDPVNQQIAEAFLEKLGVDTVIVNNGLEALECWRLHQNEFRLILMDCQMPIMDGYEATRLIRYEELQMGEKKPVVIIAFTANAYAEDENRCLESGMNDFMIKPLFADQFYNKLFAWMPELKKQAEAIKRLPGV